MATVVCTPVYERRDNQEMWILVDVSPDAAKLRPTGLHDSLIEFLSIDHHSLAVVVFNISHNDAYLTASQRCSTWNHPRDAFENRCTAESPKM